MQILNQQYIAFKNIRLAKENLLELIAEHTTNTEVQIICAAEIERSVAKVLCKIVGVNT